MLTALQGYCKDRAVIGLATDENNLSSIYVGILLDYDNSHLRLLKISQHGYPNGILLLPLHKVVYVENRTQYLKLMENRTRSWAETDYSLSTIDRAPDMPVLANELQYMADKSILGIFECGPNLYKISGKVLSVADTTVHLQHYNDLGEEDGTLHLSKFTMMAIRHSGQAERLIR